MSDQRPDRDDEPALLEELGRALGHDPDAVPPPERVAAIRAAAAAATGDTGDTAARSGPPGSARRVFLAGGVAAGVGGVAGYLGRRASEPEPVALPAPPTEQISFRGDAQVTTSALVNHTWGTELLLDLQGLTAGSTYDVVYDATTGEVVAGSLLAVADVVMKCRFNAAALRADVTAIELRGADGAVVLRAELPSTPAT
jgi:hypothetical protein